jgi:thiosulfate dehydrogenase [quinone] large subunit
VTDQLELQAMQDRKSEVGFEGSAGPLLVGLLAIQIFLGYEWVMSGLSKVLSGTFVSGLADEMTDKSAGLSGWYKSFLDGTVIPNAELFGVLVQVGELALGVVLIATAILWLTRWSTLGLGARQLLLVVIVLSGVATTIMNVNFHLANGASHPWLIAAAPFDEGVDLDSLMPIIQLIISAVAFTFLRRVRAARPATSAERAIGASAVHP